MLASSLSITPVSFTWSIVMDFSTWSEAFEISSAASAPNLTMVFESLRLMVLTSLSISSLVASSCLIWSAVT